MGLLAFVIFRSLQQNKKAKSIIENQKEEVELQKHLLEEKNKEVMDSITYAKRIQTAILPPDKAFKTVLPSSFILYKPKDIVSGDFYWLEQKDKKIMLAAVDCTGHGVPGAMVSVVGHNSLNRAVREFGLTQPAQILDKLTQLVEETFEKSESEVKDGMDISLGCIDLENRKLEWAGANNPLWILDSESGEMREIKADKQPIGKFDYRKPFTNHIIDFKKGDIAYFFTDGFADQFGGPHGKKFKYKQLESLLVSLSKTDLADQKEHILIAYEEWRGNLEQVDDVCIIGVKL